MNTEPARCIVRLADGKPCGKRAVWLDLARNGFVCDEHRDKLEPHERIKWLDRTTKTAPTGEAR